MVERWEDDLAPTCQVVWRGWVSSVFTTFFFQGEGGIRDSSVTGVQTCALPIYDPREIPNPASPTGPVAELVTHLERELAQHFRSKPARIMWPMRDPAFTPAVLEDWRKTLPDAPVTQLDDASHFVQEDAQQIHGLSTNVLVSWFERTPRDNIHLDAQEFLEVLEQADVIKKRSTRLKVHEQIEVAVRTSLAPTDGAEHGHPLPPPFLPDAPPLS